MSETGRGPIGEIPRLTPSRAGRRPNGQSPNGQAPSAVIQP
jgi:hypothetical protein